MDSAELVRLVLKELLKRLAAQAPSAWARVLAPREPSLEARVRPLLEAWHGSGLRLAFDGEPDGEAEAKAVLLPELSCSDMADLAAGRASTPRMRELLGLLLKGRKVQVLDFEYRRHAGSCPDALYRLYEGYEGTLKGYGLSGFRPRAPESALVRTDLVTAETVRRAAAEGTRTLRLPDRTKVTPLALDAAKGLGMSLVRERQSEAGT